MIRNGHNLIHGLPYSHEDPNPAPGPIKNWIGTKETYNGVSFGKTEAGYDIRLKQDVRFVIDKFGVARISILEPNEDKPKLKIGRFCLASAIEEFDMPNDLVGVVHDKSTWARMGLSVFNTVIEPGWKGFLTLELVYHGQEDLHIPAGSGIAQVLFHELRTPAAYSGKYQNQRDKPVPASFSEGPVAIIDAFGVHPERLNNAVREQKEFYCSVCYERQFETSHGLVCSNGHGGADSLDEPKRNI